MTDFIKRQAIFDAIAALHELAVELNPYDSQRDLLEGTITTYESLLSDTLNTVKDLKEQLTDIKYANTDYIKIVDLVNDAYDELDYLERTCELYDIIKLA